MKKRHLVIVMVTFLFGSISAFAADKTETFKVFGNCGMCESRIEKAALAVEGVAQADWNKESKMIEVQFDDTKTNIHQVHMAIAKAGYDTEMHRAQDEDYNQLPGCCQYERSKSEK